MVSVYPPPFECRSRSLSQIEYLVVNFDERKRQVKLSLRQADILRALAEDEELVKQGGGVPDLQRTGHNKYGERIMRPHSQTDTLQGWRDRTRISSRVWSVHVGSNAGKTVGYWLQGSVIRRI